MSATWRVTTASERGSSHTGDSPNQDAVLSRTVVTSDGTSTTIAAVSDGHGGARYVRSDLGAATAVKVVIDVVAD